MSDQMKYLLIAVGLCLLGGCGKPEANNPGDDRPEAEKTPYEKLISGSVQYRYSHEAADFGAEVCRAMLQAEPFEITSWRQVMKDYGFSDQVMASLEGDLEKWVSLGAQPCGRKLAVAIGEITRN